MPVADKVAFQFDPFELVGIDPPEYGIDQARDEIAKYIVDQVISYSGDGKSPVAGGQWKRTLEDAYKKFKKKEGGNSYADMILTGEMMAALECVRVGDMLELRIQGDQAGKADGHNNHSGKSTLPAREFIPKDGKTFKNPILAGIREIALGYFK